MYRSYYGGYGRYPHRTAEVPRYRTFLGTGRYVILLPPKVGTVKALCSVKGPKFGHCRVFLYKELSTRWEAISDRC